MIAGVAGDYAQEGNHQENNRYARVEAGHRYSELLRTLQQARSERLFNRSRVASLTKVTDICGGAPGVPAGPAQARGRTGTGETPVPPAGVFHRITRHAVTRYFFKQRTQGE